MSKPIPALNEAVLIVDDDADFRELTAWVAERLGFDALTAEDCESGLATLRRERGRVVVVLLDYFMPGMDPLHCAGAFRALGPVPIVLCTAAVDAAQRAREVGLDRWLSKPFDLERLRQTIRDARAAARPA